MVRSRKAEGIAIILRKVKKALEISVCTALAVLVLQANAWAWGKNTRGSNTSALIGIGLGGFIGSGTGSELTIGALYTPKNQQKQHMLVYFQPNWGFKADINTLSDDEQSVIQVTAPLNGYNLNLGYQYDITQKFTIGLHGGATRSKLKSQDISSDEGDNWGYNIGASVQVNAREDVAIVLMYTYYNAQKYTSIKAIETKVPGYNFLGVALNFTL